MALYGPATHVQDRRYSGHGDERLAALIVAMVSEGEVGRDSVQRDASGNQRRDLRDSGKLGFAQGLYPFESWSRTLI